MTIKAIETRYKGYRFRSRLEARWAVFFDALDVEWRYEPEGFDLGEPLGYYLPDFYLPKFNSWAEVKPEIPQYETAERKKLYALLNEESEGVRARGVFLGQIGQWDTTSWEDLGFWQPIPSVYNLALRVDEGRGSAFSDGGTLLCPLCGDTYIHLGQAENIAGNDEYASGRGVKGDAIVIPAECEASWHTWEIEFGFHKGNTRFRVTNMKEHIGDFGLILTSGNEYKLSAAVAKAKAARFEHGETPK